MWKMTNTGYEQYKKENGGQIPGVAKATSTLRDDLAISENNITDSAEEGKKFSVDDIDEKPRFGMDSQVEATKNLVAVHT